MKNCMIAGVMLLGFWALYVAFHTPPAIARGADLRHNCGSATIWNDMACEYYVGGVAEGIYVAGHPTICFPSKFDARSALALVRQYLERHPGGLAQWSPRIVQSAFQNAYPCRGGEVRMAL